jgi:hypothetical protein
MQGKEGSCRGDGEDYSYEDRGEPHSWPQPGQRILARDLPIPAWSG